MYPELEFDVDSGDFRHTRLELKRLELDILIPLFIIILDLVDLGFVFFVIIPNSSEHTKCS